MSEYSLGMFFFMITMLPKGSIKVKRRNKALHLPGTGKRSEYE